MYVCVCTEPNDESGANVDASVSCHDNTTNDVFA